jgi:DNA-binding transcriptional LysR family regulator
MNIREIEIFRTVMLEGSMSRAARQLKIAQPAVSKYVAQLERRLGLELFRRVGNRVTPTPEAYALADQVQRVFVSLDQVERFMSDLSQLKRGHVTFACMPLLSLSVIPEVLVGFMAERPEVSISLQTRSSARAVEWVATRQVDFGVGISSVEHSLVDFEEIAALELFCALPPGDPLERKRIIEVEDLADRDIITLSNHDRSQLAIDALLEQTSVRPRRRIEVFWTSVAMELAMRGGGIAFVDCLSASLVAGGLDQLRPFRPAPEMKIGFFTPRHWDVPALSRALMDEIRQNVVKRNQSSASMLR